MCDFIYLAVPKTQVAALHASIPDPFRLWPSDNRTLLQQLPPKFAPFWLIAGQCSCGLWPSGHSEASPSSPKARSGLSSAKAARALRDRQNAKISQQATTPGPHAFLGCIKAILGATRGPLYLHVAMYGGSQDGDIPPIAPVTTIQVEDTLPEALPRETLLILTTPWLPNPGVQWTRCARH